MASQIREIAATRPVPRRGLRREEAAMYVGVSPSKFDDLVRRKIMPAPRRVDSCVIWDMRRLDQAFDDLPGEEHSAGDDNPYDDVSV